MLDIDIEEELLENRDLARNESNIFFNWEPKNPNRALDLFRSVLASADPSGWASKHLANRNLKLKIELDLNATLEY